MNGTRDRRRHAVAVVRVELREEPEDGLLVELIEVVHDHPHDRHLGWATTPEGACRVLGAWLRDISRRQRPQGQSMDDDVTGP